jgi:NTP pyrophosphatase (non-canonical NTP hydrolase)
MGRENLGKRLGPTTHFGRTGRHMDIKKLTDRAMEIRGRFAAFEKARHGREWTREELMQGFVVDVGDLMKLVMAKSGSREVDDVDPKLAHELSDCLWCVLVLYRMYGLDPQTEFLKTMDELDRSIAEKMKAL